MVIQTWRLWWWDCHRSTWRWAKPFGQAEPEILQALAMTDMMDTTFGTHPTISTYTTTDVSLYSCLSFSNVVFCSKTWSISNLFASSLQLWFAIVNSQHFLNSNVSQLVWRKLKKQLYIELICLPLHARSFFSRRMVLKLFLPTTWNQPSLWFELIPQNMRQNIIRSVQGHLYQAFSASL